jgi:hypothetical protein
LTQHGLLQSQDLKQSLCLLLAAGRRQPFYPAKGGVNRSPRIRQRRFAGLAPLGKRL